MLAPDQEIDPAILPEGLREADLIVTTIFHAPRVQRIAEELNKPLVVGAVHPEVVHAIERHLKTHRLTVVCVDPRFGERFRASLAGRSGQRVRIVLADDPEGLAALDASEPVFCTRAAYEPVRDAQLRLLTPLSPFLAPQCARDVVEVLIRLNMEAQRSYVRPSPPAPAPDR